MILYRWWDSDLVYWCSNVELQVTSSAFKRNVAVLIRKNHVLGLRLVYIFVSRAGIVQWYSAEIRTGWSGVRVPTGAGNLFLHHHDQTGSGTHPASYPMGTRGTFLGVKRPGHGFDHSPPPSAKVKTEWSYNSTPSISLHGVVLS
jgi:hypothetical protein